MFFDKGFLQRRAAACDLTLFVKVYFFSFVSAAEKTINKESFSLSGVTWRMIWDERGKAFYFFNTATGVTQWTDPRKQENAALHSSGRDTMIAFLIFLLPFIILAICGGAYLLYIKVKYPDVLASPKKAKAKSKYEHSLIKETAAKKSPMKAAGASHKNLQKA
ncbi:hypothetical protein CEUSTIGMA_g4835.t1 [Chlamydomonas eustigma]|uniref:WW domain-containing protein n=1 Tax=Chlamydomonas eustigma TaxID=1157962 RepID=A0A250X375_9CHLO|nr:hypothetical protein CEUSTIGMA_g4835.t1 [Chlamydomonas eustigma]|eukprot:GAX77389.1 hypothetical protein CEUSTIGMA_g4835.t1 [Chlamydomonas eustigma]